MVAGARIASKGYEPSLMPRSTIDQGLITGGAFLTGFAVGATASLVADFLPSRAVTPILRLSGTTVAGLRTARLIADRSAPLSGLDPAKAAWVEVGSEVLAAVGIARIMTGSASLLSKGATIATVTGSTIADTVNAASLHDASPDEASIAKSAAIGLGASGAVAGVAALARLGGVLAGLPLRKPSAVRGAANLIGTVATAAVIGLAAKATKARLTARIAAGNRSTEVGFADQPARSSVSGSVGSHVPYATLGLQGRRFVSEATAGSEIAAVMGDAAVAEPIRVYVGAASAESHEARIDLAIEELDRTGAFGRSLIVAASPAGTGYVNYIMAEAVELMSRGDCATVAIQYGSLPSMLSMNRTEDASRLYAMLLSRIRAECDERGTDTILGAYGESLGALTGLAGMALASTGSSPIVDRSLWVGTPQGSAPFTRLTDDGVPVFDNPVALESYLAEHDPPGHLLLNHDNDPVTKFAMSDGCSMPQWLATSDRGRGTNPKQRWLPGVALFQGLIDTKNAATVIPGQFLSTGHDYRADLAAFVRVAFDFEVSPEQMAQLEDRLRLSEVKRSEAIALGTIQSA